MDHSQTNMDSQTQLAAIDHSGKYEVDRLLCDVARLLKQNGLRVGGVVRSNRPQPGDHRCDMILEELTTGQTVSISQQPGKESRGCRLDTAALEHVVGLVDASLEQGIDILIVNKFGKREADGRGFSATIAQAVTSATPVLVTLNRSFDTAWQHFSGGEGEILSADQVSVVQWLTKTIPAESMPKRDRS